MMMDFDADNKPRHEETCHEETHVDLNTNPVQLHRTILHIFDIHIHNHVVFGCPSLYEGSLLVI